MLMQDYSDGESMAPKQKPQMKTVCYVSLRQEAQSLKEDDIGIVRTTAYHF